MALEIDKKTLRIWLLWTIARAPGAVTLSYLDYDCSENMEGIEAVFSDLVFDLRREEHLSFKECYSGTEDETCFIDITDTENPATKRLLFDEDHMPRLSGAELKAARDRVLAYIYEHGAANYGYSMKIDDIVKNAGVNQMELRDVVNVLINQGLMSKSTMDSIGLNNDGQSEAERLIPTVPMRAIHNAGLHIDARYSIVQIAGENSTQSANQTIDASEMTQLLSQIEESLPSLAMEPAAKQEASGLLDALKRGASRGTADAVTRAVAASLSGLLTAAGSPLGKSLLVLLGISV
ncbi:MAG: hypothetical protein H2044_13610 [Rhizobiales bacterium]|nr:hypothetical protein [Hyphomicrobiales bacterium]